MDDHAVASENEPSGARARRPAIVSPANNSTLKAQIVTFTWTGGADEHWLRIGTRPNASDLYESPSLGAATSHTVTGLPLDGERLYVRLESRVGARIVASTHRYTAGVRKGLAVVVDFADSRLEDWQGPGFNSMAEVQAMLDLMTEHWHFLSRGREQVEWDLLRVQVPESLAPDAFPHIREFREAVMARVDVDVSDYDVNADTVIDSVWIIPSARAHDDSEPGFVYLRGGSVRLTGFNSFLDTQASGSVTGGYYGNFNHEFGHNSGLPDLYGPFSTVNGLTFMGATSWHVPADDATAFERERLGWLDPIVVGASRSGIVLPSAHEAMAAVKVPTARPYEYFLIEYRKTPDCGYGSLAQPYDGLAIYHVLTPSTQRLNPPILALEPADGAIVPETEPAPTDLFYPGNPVMDLSRAMRSHLTNEPVFRLQNVRWAKKGIAFDIEILGDGGPIRSPNLVSNPSFEQEANGAPASWTPDDPSAAGWSSEVARTGARSVQLAATTPSDIAWHQGIAGLDLGRTYLLCGWIQGEDIVPYESKHAGGNISAYVGGDLVHADAGSGSFDWREACVAFGATEATADVMCRLGSWSSTATGRQWCDDLGVHLLSPAF